MTYLTDHHVPASIDYAKRAADTQSHIGERVRWIWSQFVAILKPRRRRPHLHSLYGDQLNEFGLRLSDVERSALGENSACHPRGFSHQAMLGSPFGR